MIYDLKELQREYALCYADKSRIRFIESYFSTFNATKGKKTQFHCFPRQRAFLKALSENRNVIAIKPRQCGITTLSSAWAAAECAFSSKASPQTILCIANKLDQANEIILKVRDFLDQVPRWIWGSEYFSTDPNSEKNLKSIFIKDAKSELKLFNGCRIIARASGPNAARGISAVSVLILDEAAFIEDGISVYTTAAATMASNPNSKTVMVSTPNGRDELYYNTYRQALAKENSFVAVQFRWYQDPRFNKRLVWKKKNEKTGEWMYDEDPIIDNEGNIKYDEERWARLEKSGWKPEAPWYIEMSKSFNNDSIKIAQELDVSFMGSADNVVASEFIEQQETLNVREPLEDFKDPLVEETWFWKKPIDGHRYILACLPQGEKVLTQRGLVNVEDVKDDDLLVTKEGEYTRIRRRMVRQVENEEVVEIKPYGQSRGTKFTWNHPIWSSLNSKNKQTTSGNVWVHDFKFVDAREITLNSWLMIPNVYKQKELTHDELVKIWQEYEYKYNNQFSSCEYPLENELFWWYCGIWLAEGFIHTKKNGGKRITTSHNINETLIHEKIYKFITDVMHRTPSFLHQDVMGNGCKIIFNSAQLAKFLEKNFGKYAHGKFISEWIKFLPIKYKIKLVEGYLDGDGSYIANTINATSVSLKLLEDIQDILFSCGIASTISDGRQGGIVEIFNKIRNSRPSYHLRISARQRIKYSKLLGYDENYALSRNSVKKTVYLSDDEKYIYLRVRKITKSKETLTVYNFETESDSHTFCCRGIATHNCDSSRGTAADNTAIEVIDMDGRDENGIPIIEQVAEYVGKKLGDDIGAICYQYATMYNDAFTVFDATGGQSDAAIITMLQMGYKNLYYEDSNQKTYMVQHSTKVYDSYTDKLPGFHFQGNRYPVLSNFAGLVRNNEFKIRSTRVINELNTWIFKGDTGRIDHMDGSHDDTLCALAMGLFVMQYSVNRIQSTINKDKAILNAYMVGGSISSNKSRMHNGKVIAPNVGLPFYTQNSFPKNRVINGNYMWVFG
jgi:hypothetical protein